MNRRELFAFAALVSPQHLLNLTDEQAARKAQDAFAFADKMLDLCEDPHEEDSDADDESFADFKAETVEEMLDLRDELDKLKAALGEKPADTKTEKKS